MPVDGDGPAQEQHPSLQTSLSPAVTEATFSFDYARCPPPTTFDYYSERYYHQYQIENYKGVKGNNYRVLQHSNGMCVICVDPSHALIAATRDPLQGVTIDSITFGSGRSNAALTPDAIQVVGKRKKKALICQADTRLCTIKLSNGTEYAVPACLNGFVLELNVSLFDKPWLVVEAPVAEGFLAIINPSYKTNLSTLSKVWTASGGDTPLDGQED